MEQSSSWHRRLRGVWRDGPSGHRRADEALEQIRALREESEREANRQACEETAKKIIEMSDAMAAQSMSKWNALGGDPKWKRLEKDFVDRKCQEVLK